MVDSVWKHQADEQWLRLLRSGDHQAFAQFIDKYKQTVFMCCRRLGLSDDQIEDVAAETFLAAYRALPAYSAKSELSTWLWAIAYRQAVNCLRKSRKLRSLEHEIEQQIPDAAPGGPLQAIQAHETDKLVWQAVQRLPRLWALAVILHYREEKSVADIAKIMQTNQNTVKTYLYRGREKLKEILAASLGDDSDAH